MPRKKQSTAEENAAVMMSPNWTTPDRSAELLDELRTALDRAEAARVEAERIKDDWLDAKAVHRRSVEVVREIEREIVEGGTGRPILDGCGTIGGDE